jgi:two-component system sensor histidine kinase ResE
LGVIAIFRDVTREVKADRARNDFIASLSRELRAPLTTIKGYSELILNGLMADYPPQYMQIQQTIYSGSERVVEILDNAIKISAQNRHQILPRFEEVDVAKMIESTAHEIQPLGRLHEVEIKQKLDPELVPIMADVKHLHRIIYNLLSNACRFTPPGGRVLIRAWLQMENWGQTKRPYLFITVADNGVGMPQEELARIFDRFHQIKHPNLSHNGGMGLGLTVVKELVELHNGRIWAESLLGKGSVFHVALPTSQEY